jgi:hypothetical protein
MKGIGDKYPLCESIIGFDKHGYASFECPAFLNFKISKKTGRYMLFYMAGYIDGDNKKNSPYIEIGKCSPF